MDIQRNEANQVEARFSDDEALVLFELLGRWEWSGLLDGEEFWEDQAEQRVIWDLHACLEPVISESFTSEYGQAVKAAQSNLRDS